MSDIRYPSHGATGLEAAPQPGEPFMRVRSVITCAAPMMPPECAGLPVWDRDECAREPRLVCAKCGIVEATPEQIEQARDAARADGTWPEESK